MGRGNREEEEGRERGMEGGWRGEWEREERRKNESRPEHVSHVHMQNYAVITIQNKSHK